ncbi:MAG: gamma-butyrobetaine hydroxylase-like domain-containing protein [Phycisphaerales bacterium]
MDSPTDIDLKKDKGLTIRWADGTTSYYPIAYLRRMSPSADMRQLREEMSSNPLTVLPSRPNSGPVVATSAELIGNYAIRVVFSDGHATGIYSWVYLRSIDPDRPSAPPA